MIKVIGLNKDVYNHILKHCDCMVKKCDASSGMIEFIPHCSLELNDDQSIFIQCGKNALDFLNYDYWRIEIE